MDNANDFEKQFTENVKSATQQFSRNGELSIPPQQASQPTPQPKPNTKPVELHNPSIFLITAIVILAIVVLVEAIALVVLINNLFYSEPDNYVDDTETSEDNVQDDKYIYDLDGKLSAMNLTCTTEDNSIYAFKTDGTYQYGDSTSSSVSGTYFITNDNLVSLQGPNSSNKILFYDGLNLADGLTIYVCE